MRKEHDFSKARKNPYARRLKKQITWRIDKPTIADFRALAEGSGIPYQLAGPGEEALVGAHRATPRRSVTRVFGWRRLQDLLGLDVGFHGIGARRGFVSSPAKPPEDEGRATRPGQGHEGQPQVDTLGLGAGQGGSAGFRQEPRAAPGEPGGGRRQGDD